MLQALGERASAILWVGSEGGIEADLVKRAGIAYTSIPAGGVHGVGLKIIPNSLKLTRGYFAARRIIADFRPDVLFFTGGYVAIPTGLAGRKIPTMVCLPDIEPALAIKVLSRFADQITAPAEASRDYFPAGQQLTVTGYPTRASLATEDRDAAYRAFELSPDKPTLFVTGGSLGARSINQALLAALPELLVDIQIIHSTGETTWPEVQAAQQALPAELAANYRPFPYLHEQMGAAFSAADLVVTRAGASILGELPLFGVPGILVPYPHAWRYQKVNADYLVEQGAAQVLRDEDLVEKLLATVRDLMHNKPRLGQMKAAMAALARPQAAAQIAQLLVEMQPATATPPALRK